MPHRLALSQVAAFRNVAHEADSPPQPQAEVTDYTALVSGTNWNNFGATGRPTIVTYSFPATAPDYVVEAFGLTRGRFHFSQVDEITADLARQALAMWANTSGLTFVEDTSGNGDIQFGFYDLLQLGETDEFAAFAFYPVVGIDASEAFQLDIGGDIFLDNNLGYSLDFMRLLLLHEIGHALGLKHPFEGTPTLSYGFDTTERTVMSYTGPVVTQLGPLDHMAARHLYGDNAQDGTHLQSWSWDAATNTLTQTAGAGADIVRGVRGANIIFGGDGADILAGGVLGDRLNGDSGADTLHGNEGDDMLSGGAGVDTLIGGVGNDTYVDPTGDVIIELGNDTGDIISSSASFDLATQPQIEHLTLTGSAALIGRGSNAANELRGNAGASTLFGNGGADTLWAGTGSTTMNGGSGNDIYVLQGAAATVAHVFVEAVNGGIDAVRVDRSFSLAGIANVENVTATAVAVELIGNELNNLLTGSTGNDTLIGGEGNDTLNGSVGVLHANDYDILRGGDGDDTYINNRINGVVNGVRFGIVEEADGGYDTMLMTDGQSGDLRTVEHVERLILAQGFIGRGPDGFGSARNDVIIGDRGDNSLYGFEGDDTLEGGGGRDLIFGQEGIDTASYASSALGVTVNLTITDYQDTGGSGHNRLVQMENLVGSAHNDRLTGDGTANRLDGGDGNDVLDGGAGIDTLAGGRGDDVYVNIAGDTIVELAGEGRDTIESDISVSLAAFDHIENVTLNGAGATDATGNGLDNHLKGNAAANRLTGFAGADTLEGGSGTDTLVCGIGNDVYVNPTGSTIIELAGQGFDRVISDSSFSLATLSYVERLELSGAVPGFLRGNNFANQLVGNRGSNTITGFDGDDVLFGLGGRDTITGGMGRDQIAPGLERDTIRWDSVAESTGAMRDFVSEFVFSQGGAAYESLDFHIIPTAVRATITTGALNAASFDGDLQAAVNAPRLGAGEAVLFDPSGGDLNITGHIYLVVDANGQAGYQAGQDYVVQFTSWYGTLTVANFI